MKPFEYTPEKRREKLSEKKALSQRKEVRDRRYHTVEDDSPEDEWRNDSDIDDSYFNDDN